ncbi:MAG: hypothetical protein K6U14_06915 [Firmicutes bacterium]|nr:hypothetical protein [Alicyclobacillaceae bacterium]MCL6497350.1 hypothetical protein [Bacillota bacterium]
MMAPFFGLSPQAMLSMYNLHNGWDVALLVVAGAFLFGIVGFAVGLILGTNQPAEEVGHRTSHPHAA